MAQILVIDDEPAVRRLVVLALGDRHRIIEAEDGAAGMARLQAFFPDVVITDLLMPVMEGIETIRAIQRTAPDTKIIAVSGGGKDLLEFARALGAAEILEKPFRARQLRRMVAKLLRPAIAAEAAAVGEKPEPPRPERETRA